MDDNFADRLEEAKRASTGQLLLRCARLFNEHALRTAPAGEGPRPRPAHMALFPHIALQGTRPSHLAAKLGISKQAVGQLVDDLEAMGTVARIPDPDDGRARRVVFTDRGRAGMLAGIGHLDAVSRDVAQVIGEEPMEALHRSLVLLLDHLESLSV